MLCCVYEELAGPNFDVRESVLAVKTMLELEFEPIYGTCDFFLFLVEFICTSEGDCSSFTAVSMSTNPFHILKAVS